MRFPAPLIEGRLIRRYKRFLADIELADGSEVTAHCANPGSMMGVADPGSRVWLSPSPNPKAKLDWRWELIEVDGHLVGINTAHPNRIVEDAVGAGEIAELAGYAGLRREVKYGANSRIDLLLEDPGRCYVEVKNVTLKRGGTAEFPDAPTARGRKHLGELIQMAADGHRAVMFFLVQRADCAHFGPARDIDPDYADTLSRAADAGVELICYHCDLSIEGIKIAGALPIRLR